MLTSTRSTLLSFSLSLSLSLSPLSLPLFSRLPEVPSQSEKQSSPPGSDDSGPFRRRGASRNLGSKRGSNSPAAPSSPHHGHRSLRGKGPTINIQVRQIKAVRKNLKNCHIVGGKFGRELNLAAWLSIFATAKLKSGHQYLFLTCILTLMFYLHKHGK